MLENLQKQIIIDNYLIGTTTNLFQQHPELRALSKKTLGKELYHELNDNE